MCPSQIQCFAGKKGAVKWVEVVGWKRKRKRKGREGESSCSALEGSKEGVEVVVSRVRVCCGKELPPRVGRPVSRSA